MIWRIVHQTPSAPGHHLPPVTPVPSAGGHLFHSLPHLTPDTLLLFSIYCKVTQVLQLINFASFVMTFIIMKWICGKKDLYVYLTHYNLIFPFPLHFHCLSLYIYNTLNLQYYINTKPMLYFTLHISNH